MPTTADVLRIRFTAADLLRTRIVTAPDPMWELVLSLFALREAGPGPFDEWRHQASRAARSPRLERWLPMLFALVPRRGRFPDFLTPPQASGGLDAALEALLCLPRERLVADLDRSYPHSPPAWLRRLADGDRTARNELVGALRAYHDLVLAPYWPAVRDTVAGDRALRAEVAVTRGTQHLFAGLPAPMHWQWPVLSTDYSEPHAIDLRGRGLLLIPSYFCVGDPVSLIDPDLPPVLVYPAARAAATDDADAVQRLTPALGRTRARVLCALATPHSTSELANRVGISLASASQHAAALRAAGLVTTSYRQTARHARTDLGYALVSGR